MALPLTEDQPDRSVAPAARTTARSFLVSRLGSLLALLPLGVWTAHHLWNNLAAFSGGNVWEARVTGHSSSASAALVMACVLVPLLWHTVWGIGRMFRTRGSN